MSATPPATSTPGVDVDGMPFRDGRLRLPDGRVLAWRWWGEGAGPTILRLQGSASCRLAGSPRLWQAMGVRVLAADRPGFGHSTRAAGRGLRLVADDLAFLLDTVALEAVPIIGHSAGGPHALAMAACHGERVVSVSIKSGACHLTQDERGRVVATNRDAAVAAEQGWASLRDYLVGLSAGLLRGGASELLTDALDSDLEVFSRADRRVREAAMRVEALRQGVDGWADEAMAILGDWDFDLDAVRARVAWFHGSDDNTVPISAARRVTQRLPNCELIEVPDRGHRLGLDRAIIKRSIER